MDSNTQSKVNELNAGWRNYLCQQMNLDPNTFQLAQGALGLQTTDNSGLFRMADAVPPSSTVGYYDASSMDLRSTNYRSLLISLKGETSPRAMQEALGNFWSSWVAYKADRANWPQGATITSVYNDWKNRSPVDPGTAARGMTALIASTHQPLDAAVESYYSLSNKQTFTDSAGMPYSLYKYTATIDRAKDAIRLSNSSLEIDFSSSSMDTSSNAIFAEGSLGGRYDIFSAGASGSFDQQNSKAASSKLSIKGTIGSYATLTSSPDGDWYSSDEVSRAFKGKDNADIWDFGSSAGNWEAFFGQPNGSLSRYVSQIVLVSDYCLTVTSGATYSQSDLQKMQAEAHIDVWPFFSAKGKASHNTEITLNRNSNLEVTQTLGKGKIQIWGVTIISAH